MEEEAIAPPCPLLPPLPLYQHEHRHSSMGSRVAPVVRGRRGATGATQDLATHRLDGPRQSPQQPWSVEEDPVVVHLASPEEAQGEYYWGFQVLGFGWAGHSTTLSALRSHRFYEYLSFIPNEVLSTRRSDLPPICSYLKHDWISNT
jgi:hypothetical protein